MTPVGVEIRFHAAPRQNFLDDEARQFSVRYEPGWVHVFVLTGEGNGGTPRQIPVESYPSETVRLARRIYRSSP